MKTIKNERCMRAKCKLNDSHKAMAFYFSSAETCAIALFVFVFHRWLQNCSFKCTFTLSAQFSVQKINRAHLNNLNLIVCVFGFGFSVTETFIELSMQFSNCNIQHCNSPIFVQFALSWLCLICQSCSQGLMPSSYYNLYLVV